MKYLNKILNNKINFKEKNNFALIIGLTPSKGARSPALWNSAYKFFNKKTKMFPADVKEKNLGKLCNYLKIKQIFPWFICYSAIQRKNNEISRSY